MSSTAHVSARKLFHNYKNRARHKGILFEISFEDFVLLTSARCGICGTSGTATIRRKGYDPYHYVGLDRVDPRGGYTPQNVQPCCSTCNTMKWDLSEEEFTRHVKRVWDMSKDAPGAKDWPIVEVVWVDAFSTDEWSDLDAHADAEPYRVRSIGYLLKETVHHLILIKSVSLKGEAGCMSLKIPQGMIESVTELDFTRSNVPA